MEQNKRRQVAKISVFITSIFVIFLSVTYAFINMTLTGTKRQVITAGSLEIELEEENAITLSNAMPMYDEVGMIGEPFNFRLVNKSTETVNYIVALEDITDSTKEKLGTSIVKYGLTKDENTTIDFLSSLTKNRIDRGKINGIQTIHYSLRLWIDAEVEDEELIKEKTLRYKITLTYSNGSDNIMKEREVTHGYLGGGEWDHIPSNTDYYQYSSQITNISLENSINIPEAIPEDKRWDMSEAADKSVMAYIEEDGTLESNETAYKLHIQANGKIVANQNSEALFYGFSNLTSIDGFENLDVSDTNFYFGSGTISTFNGCPKLELDLSKLDVSNVTNMSRMFSYYSGQSVTIDNWNSSKVTDMSHMFAHYSGQGLIIDNWDTSNVTNMSYMFSGYSSSQPLNLSNLNTSKVTDMFGMFSSYSSSQLLDLSNLNTSNVTDMSEMFSNYSGGVLTIGNWDTAKVTDMSFMFFDYSSNQPLDLSNLNTSNVTDMASMFGSYSSNQPLDLSYFATSNVTDMSGMFSNYSSNQLLNLSNLNTSSVTDMAYMFSNYSSSQPLNLSHLNTSNVINMAWMFSNYSSNQPLDLSSFNISKVTEASYMFDSIKADCLITVKDEAMKAWILERNSSLTNVVVKSA